MIIETDNTRLVHVFVNISFINIHCKITTGTNINDI